MNNKYIHLCSLILFSIYTLDGIQSAYSSVGTAGITGFTKEEGPIAHTFVLGGGVKWPVSVSADYRGCSDKKFILIPRAYPESDDMAHDKSNANLPVYRGSYTIKTKCELKGIVTWIIEAQDGIAKRDTVVGKDFWWTNPGPADWRNGVYGSGTITIGWDAPNRHLNLQLPNAMAKPDRQPK